MASPSSTPEVSVEIYPCNEEGTWIPKVSVKFHSHNGERTSMPGVSVKFHPYHRKRTESFVDVYPMPEMQPTAVLPESAQSRNEMSLQTASPPPRSRQDQQSTSTLPTIHFTGFGGSNNPIRVQQESRRPPADSSQGTRATTVNHAVPGSSGRPHPFVFEPARNRGIIVLNPMMLAVNNRDLTSLKSSLEGVGANVNAYGPCRRLGHLMEGVTPLFIAASNGDESIVRYLIEKGANVSLRTLSPVRGYDGMTPLHAAVNFADHNSPDAYRKVMQILIENGADPSAPTLNGVPTWALCNHDPVHFRLLISKGMRLDQDDNGRNVLHYWTLCGNRTNAYNAIQAIPDLDAFMDKVNEFDLTPLNFLALNLRGHQDDPVFEFLLNHPSISQEKKMDALDLAGSGIILGPFVKADNPPVSKAFLYWTRAMEIRLSLPSTVRRAGECASVARLDKISPFREEYQMHACLVLLGIISEMKSKRMMDYCWPLIDPFRQQLEKQCKKWKEGHLPRLQKLMAAIPSL